MIDFLEHVFHIAPPELKEEAPVSEEIEERVEAVVAKVSSLEARIESLEQWRDGPETRAST